jgi:hypothetical protein
MADADSTILLFFKEPECDKWFKGDRVLKRLMKPAYSRVAHRAGVTGFAVWHKLLVTSLRGSGYTVRINDFRYARSHPDHPVGIIGYPFILKQWDLPNPAVLGPAMFDHPNLASSLMDDPRFHSYIVTCQWMSNVFSGCYPPHCLKLWNAGIDTETDWPNTANNPKDTDILIYDKIRWQRDRMVPELLEPIKQLAADQGLTHQVLRYGRYAYADYKKALARSRLMVFLCEHETQGMAYQEAMASNVPVIAWDPGWWADPCRLRLGVGPIRTTSVPYFDQRCGTTFRTAGDFYSAFTSVWSKLDAFHPREFVQERLSLEASARTYASAYFEAGGMTP